MLNASATDWEILRDKIPADIWALFDNVSISVGLGDRMPSLSFFRRFLEMDGSDPRCTVFVSTVLDHVVSVSSLGITGLSWTSYPDVESRLCTLTRDSVSDREAYLLKHAGKMWSTTNTGVALRENFFQLLVLEITRDPNLVDLPEPERRMRFFRGAGVLTTRDFPPDIDTASIAHSVIPTVNPKASILTMRNEDGITLTYFDPSRPRIVLTRLAYFEYPVVCMNALTFSHTNGRAHELPETLDWVYAVLHNRAYAAGTLYYYGADSFLYFISRFLAVPRPLPFHANLHDLFKERLTERFGEPGDALALAMRILAATSVGLSDRRGCEQLLAMQAADGAWQTGWMYKYGMSGVLVKNQGLTTAMAVAAIRRYQPTDVHACLEEPLSSGGGVYDGPLGLAGAAVVRRPRMTWVNMTLEAFASSESMAFV
ncbi:hypothetical protein BC628DRAFT_1407287 [Trametes gibbosa]|nr:hypothetical protein BC628DRAFT_1407287 [Trametes gibbosa]